jgi:hypothetical protein
VRSAVVTAVSSSVDISTTRVSTTPGWNCVPAFSSSSASARSSGIAPRLLSLLPGQMTPVQFRFTPIGSASWSIDDVYVDPKARGQASRKGAACSPEHVVLLHHAVALA